MKQLRASIQAALENAERLRQRLLLARALNAASEPAEPVLLDLGEVLRELQEDIGPLFEAAGKRLELHLSGESIVVCGDKPKLMQALFVLIEYLLRYSTPDGPFVIGLEHRERQQARLRIEASSSLPISPESEPRVMPCEIELARRTFIGAGGDFRWFEGDSQPSVWVATLPMK